MNKRKSRPSPRLQPANGLLANPTPVAPMVQAWNAFSAGAHAKAEALCRSILASQANQVGALTLLGIITAQTRRTAEAEALLRRAADLAPHDPTAHNNYGNVLRDLGRHTDALERYERAISLLPSYSEAHYNHGVTLHELKRFDDAIVSYGRALASKPDHAPAYNNRGTALREVGRFEEALASYDRALALRPSHPEAHNNRGVALQELKRFEEALVSYDQALALRPNYAEAHNNRGVVLQQLERLDESLASYERAVAINPDYVEAYTNRGDTLRQMQRFDESLASYERALAIQPDCAQAYNNRGVTLWALGRRDDAMISYERALAIKPEYAEALQNRGVALHDLKRFDDALASYERAIAVNRNYADAYRCRAATLHQLKRSDEAVASYERALALAPETKYLRGECRHLQMQLCDWANFEADLEQLSAAIARGEPVVTPFAALSLFESPRLQREATATWVRNECSPRVRLPPISPYPRHEKLRIGYFSADFRNHAVGALTAELFETHDRSKLDLTAFSLGADVRDELRARIEPAFDRFLPVGGRSDQEVAALARGLEIDIAVDLGGFTESARPNIFAHRAAPIQVSYLGYLGTAAADFIDYLIADPIIVPSDERQHYAEKIAYLPSYQANDSKRMVPEKVFTRAELGLPATGFVFCCFNASYKITPETFAGWMRILAAVPDSVLFLLGGNPVLERNLRRQATKLGVAPKRLVFGRRVAFGDYMTRYRAADLFLDTLPYNAGTTASDALWAGLPVLTCPGQSFAARMAASLLAAVGLPELIAADRNHYEQLAIQLATQPELLGRIRDRLAGARGTAALFDTPALTRNLESLYRKMHERQRAGLPPEHLFSDNVEATNTSAVHATEAKS